MGLLIFDGDCGFCTSSVSFIRRWINSNVDATPWQRADLNALGLTHEQCAAAVQYRAESERWSSGGAAVIALLRDSRLPWRWLGRLLAPAIVARAVERLYQLVADNRHRLPGGTPACQLPAPRD